MLIILIALFVVPSWAEQIDLLLDPPLGIDLQPPEELRDLPTRNVIQSWITMPVDHFDPQNNDTFQMRFMFNEQFFGGNGSPIFIFIGGEWAIAAGWLLGGNMFELARENEGYMLYTEHRYYGATLPYADFTTENLRFLNVDQALADLAYFIQSLKSTPMFANSKVVLYGCSYAANMALWFKQRYPHLTVGVAASSGPIQAEVDFKGYLEVVHESFRSEGGPECLETLRQAIIDTVASLETEEGGSRVQAAYRLCQPLNVSDPYEMGYFSGSISWALSGQVQTARPGTLKNTCNSIENSGTTPMEKLGGYLRSTLQPGFCVSLSYDNYVNSYRDTTNANRLWYYQTCTEYGYYQTAPTSGTVFDPLKWLDVNFYVDLCKKAFSESMDEAFVRNAAHRVNAMFGGKQPDVNNTINIHGTVDPWHVLGAHEEDINDSSPTITIPRASHCFDTQNWLSSNTIKITQAQQAVRRRVASWLT